MLRRLLLRLRALKSKRLSSNRDITVVQLDTVYSGSIQCINLHKLLPSAKLHGIISQAVILLMSYLFRPFGITVSVGLRAKCCNTCLPSVAGRSTLSLKVYVQMHKGYVSFCLHNQHTTLLSFFPSSKYCLTELISL